jgi:thiol-disulfide isomerase/thioredoxin
MMIGVHAQDPQFSLSNLGDPAPPLRLQGWVKGSPVEKFDKGRVYLLEFWATWCRPCVAEMPHLSGLARKYRDRITVLGIDIYEDKATSMQKIRAFVDSMGDRMDFQVAVADSNFMVAAWLHGFGEQSSGIPRSFVVDSNGRLAWIGHPT